MSSAAVAEPPATPQAVSIEPRCPLDRLQALVRKYVVTTDAQRLVISLWVVHAHLANRFDQTPYLTVTSPERQCGKSRLLELLELVVPRPWATIMPSEAVLYRKVDAEGPTLLLDEVDAIFAPKAAERYEALRAILNAGHRRGHTVSRCVNFGQDLQEFEVYCPKVLAGIGVLPSTITDRAIPIRLQRKTRSERVARFFVREAAAEAAPIRAEIEGWADENGAAVAAARPEMPDELSDRMQEGCEALVAIADALGYGREARAALVELLSGGRQDERESASLQLLHDVREIYCARGEGSNMRSHDLLATLSAVEDAPWAGWYGRGLNANDLAAMLAPYGVASVSVRDPGGVGKGYRWDDLFPVWERYLPAREAEQ